MTGVDFRVLGEAVLVACECVVAYPVVEGLRLWSGWKSSVAPQYRLAWVVGLAVLVINGLALLLQQRTGVTIPAPSAFIHELWIAVLVYPLMAGLTWVGILDLVPLISSIRADQRSDQHDQEP
jgi:hypothetical protein